MNWASQPAAALSRSRGGNRDLGFASRSWRICPESIVVSESRHGGPASGSGPWLESRWSAIPPVIDTFTEAWERGEAPVVEDYLHHLDPADSGGAVELIYREYCLAEADGRSPDPSLYLARFPQHREALERLLHLHGECPTSLLGRWFKPNAAQADLPEAGDSIGPYVLRRELGRGSFARVFLAEEADLENRLIVVKVSKRVTREPWLLARARHAHIVEIVWHSLVDDGAFQLICMPFFGGATLGAVLDARHRQSRAATSGRDLLDDLDRAGAPEYSGDHNARPARAMLARLSYDRAIAWIVARLAEALDHAFSRDVAHGDVKPSNILLSADGNPMLLDFNLARDGALVADDPGRADPGGTLAYMAPERLRALASLETPLDDIIGEPETACAPDSSRAEQAPHLADLYALGMVLLEALTGRPPLAFKVPEAQDPASRGRLMRSAARVYATARERSARSIVRDSEIAGGRPITAGLATILARCLDPDPARRYGRSLELAEDLDRWRTDRSLAYADEPFWRLTVPRWLRRQRLMLIVAAVSLLTVGLVTTAVILRDYNLTLYQNLQSIALGKLAREWDDIESRAYLGQGLSQTPRLLKPDAPSVIEAARRALGDYDVLGPGDIFGAADWRLRDNVRGLPVADRADLELWILERVYRYCRALDERPDSPRDWERALKILDGTCGSMRFTAFTPLRNRLLAKLKTGSPPAPSRSTSEPVPQWLEEHLRGFVAECEPESNDTPRPPGLADVTEIPKTEALQQRRAAESALHYYTESLVLRPNSFWGHYRAAGMCHGLGRVAEAAHHLEMCRERRPDNPALCERLAGCLFALDRFSEALRLCDEALARSPDHAELYRTRAFIRSKLGQTAGLTEDLRHFEMLSHILPRSLWGGSVDGDLPGSPDRRGTVFPAEFNLEPRSARLGTIEQSGELDPEEMKVRARLARAIQVAGELELAQVETDKIVMLDPNHISARTMRVEQAIETGQFDVAHREFDTIVNHPRLMEYLKATTDSLKPFHNITLLYLQAGRVDEARTVARTARDFSYRLKRDVGWSQFYLARVYAVDGRSDPRSIKQAAEQILRAFVANPDFKLWYQGDRDFDPVRTQIDAALQRMEDPAEVRRRLASASPKRK